MTTKRVQIALLIFAFVVAGTAQESLSTVASPLHAKLMPGETLRYEVEISLSYSAGIIRGYSTTVPLGPCQLSASSVLAFSVQPVAGDGNLPVQAVFENPRSTSWQCTKMDQQKLDKALRELAASPLLYQIGPHGEVGFKHIDRDRFTYQSANDLLSTVAMDLLQTRLADRPVSVGSSWKPHGQFTYWQDYLLSGLDVSAATMRWKDSPAVAGHKCASIVSKYILAPTDSAPSPITAGGSLRQQPGNVLAGLQQVSLLFDLEARRIGWLHRYYRVENHVSVQPEEEPDPEVLTIRWEEEARARLIPEKDAIAWLAALKNFEATPEGERHAVSANSADASIAELARLAVPKKKSASAIDTLDATPKGFTRWERQFCNSSWYCSQVSIALPGEVKIAEDADLQTTYFARLGGALLTITVGPALQRKYRGLTADEELQKHTEFILANQLWMMNQPGIKVESRSTFVDAYPVRLTTFRGQRRDLAGIRGLLGLLLSPWGESFPVTCTFDQAHAPNMDATCERILASVRLRRAEPGAEDEINP